MFCLSFVSITFPPVFDAPTQLLMNYQVGNHQ